MHAGSYMYAIPRGTSNYCDKIIQIKYSEVKLKSLASVVLIVIKHCTNANCEQYS